jgi:hypothetical protein
MCCMHTTEYYSSMKVNEIMSFGWKWMELELTMLSEITQIKKDKYHMPSYMWDSDIKVNDRNIQWGFAWVKII